MTAKATIRIQPIVVIGSDVNAVRISYNSTHGVHGPSGSYYASDSDTIRGLVAETEEELKLLGCKVVSIVDYR